MPGLSGGSAPSDGTVGFLLSLLTESFAVRAFLGSLAAAALAAAAVRLELVSTPRARRLLVLAPVLTAAAAGVASVRDAFLPQLWVASFGEAGTQLLDLPGQRALVSLNREIDLLALVYAGIVAVLLCRRLAGEVVLRRTLEVARRHPVPPRLHRSLAEAAERMGRSEVRAAARLTRTEVRVLPDCPGGAFTVGLLRPVIVLDPALLTRLDQRELEGLLAHELAHVARADCVLGLLVGIFRDLTFFLPPVHIARRWLSREQEESADELAAASTRRPGALASGILKVWDRSVWAVPGAACGAVPGPRLAAGSPRLAAGSPRLALAGAGLTRDSAAQAVTSRVERLISGRPPLSRRRVLAELALALAVLSAATTTGLVVPSWIASSPDRDALAFAYLAGVPDAAVESPAFRTFRALAPPASAVPATEVSSAAAPGAQLSTVELGSCPCVESQGQLHRGVSAAGNAEHARMLWRREGHDAWMVEPRGGPGIAPARPLWTTSDSGARFGFFLVGSPS